MIGKCVFCAGPVKSGGDRHAEGKCSFAGKHGERFERKLRTKRRGNKNENLPKRGEVVGGLQKGGKHRKAAEKK